MSAGSSRFTSHPCSTTECPYETARARFNYYTERMRSTLRTVRRMVPEDVDGGGAMASNRGKIHNGSEQNVVFYG